MQRWGVMILCSILLFQTRFAFAGDQLQFIATESFSFPVEDKTHVLLEGESGFTPDVRKLYYQHAEVGVEYTAADWLDLELDYRKIWERENGRWNIEDRPHINAKIKWSYSCFDMSNRHRLEYRIREHKDDIWRYRNETALSFSIPGFREKLRIFFRDDVFIDFDAGEWSANKFEGGLAAEITEPIKWEIFFIKESAKEADGWIDINGIGSKLKVDF